ncbi:MAG: hypothetical protein CM1200mP38_0890 [Dehalococcoidia bacterium]|nr:MAG: hypothetical protein CM1200mP38_0890 [Dehalococcoidia bacterium]
MNSNIFLTGFSGSGKTDVGKYVAAKMQRSFVDLDIEISKFANMSIEEIFSVKGEVTFRQIETEILAKIQLVTTKLFQRVVGLLKKIKIIKL